MGDIIPLHKPPGYADIVAMLRLLADSMEDGTFTDNSGNKVNIGEVALVCCHNDNGAGHITVSAYGPDSNGSSATALLHAGATWLAMSLVRPE